LISTAELFAEYEAALRRYGLRLAGDADEADDLVAETFMRAYTHLAQLGGLAPYQRKAWLYRVLKNHFIDMRRASQREQTLMAQLAWAENLASTGSLEDLPNPIPEKYRRLLQMHYTLGMSSEEIGARLGVPAATVRSRLRLALQQLRKFTREE
jgi:RNA polymerase sigma-70 factor, ECF subfamily